MERISRRGMLARVLIAAEAGGAGLLSKTKIGRVILADQGISKADQLRQKYSITDTGSVIFDEPPVLVVESSAPQVLEEPHLPEVLIRPNWPREVLLRPIRQGPSDRPLIGLTIDDAFSARNEVLDALVSKGVKATFFMIGRLAASDQNFIRRALDLGYEFGNHTFSHGDLTKMTPEQMRADIRRGQEVMLAVDPRAITAPYLRPPGGARNSLSDSAGADLGHRSINWNVSGDTGATYTPEQLVRLYLNDQIDKMRNPWGSIMLIHFNVRTAVGLLGIIDGLRARGLEPVALSKLFEDGRV